MSQSVVLHQYFQICFETCMSIRAGLVTVMYAKSLVLSSDELGSRPSENIVNLMSVDATRLQDLCIYGLITISELFQPSRMMSFCLSCDQRTRLMNKPLANIKSIKFHAWEYVFIRRVLHVRNGLEQDTEENLHFNCTPDALFPAISWFMLLRFPLAMFSRTSSRDLCSSNIYQAYYALRSCKNAHLNTEQTNAIYCKPR
ncbi:uncharacterized protein EDB93DRAFT_1339720 [Suillus bovinus]|uniref:uncharacterized protein n=1 Tax=Suillus bovinus TaxID=48563 RepID=UPI001B87FFA7|nr:uncharacterized protein EDB93DRAFT_1339720 [Suillus bovinus]KAG2134914.1 hypothetical protein EDB93DRAFT_1339720 [Suillus bovinus]